MGLVRVAFEWSDEHGSCEDCGNPSAFTDVETRTRRWDAVCAANRAADGENITRISEE